MLFRAPVSAMAVWFPEITLTTPLPVPPIVLLVAADPLTATPALVDTPETGATPERSVPIRFPSTKFPELFISTFHPKLPEMRFRAAGKAPPMVVLTLDPLTSTPLVLGTAVMPAASVPRKLPSIEVPTPPSTTSGPHPYGDAVNPLMIKPRIVVGPARMCSNVGIFEANEPFNSTVSVALLACGAGLVFALDPFCVYPSTVTAQRCLVVE